MMENLFVYGTLCPGRSNAHLLTQIDGTFIPASVTAAFHEQGWGLTEGYPAIKLDKSAQKVSGFVFQSENLPDYWPELDEFEGDAYLRVVTPVSIESGEIIDAWIYTLHPNKVEK